MTGTARGGPAPCRAIWRSASSRIRPEWYKENQGSPSLFASRCAHRERAGIPMRRCALACIAIIGLATLPGCSADPAYESIFQDHKAAVERATAAMKNVRDVKSLKESNELILKEADTIHELTKKLGELG